VGAGPPEIKVGGPRPTHSPVPPPMLGFMAQKAEKMLPKIINK